MKNEEIINIYKTYRKRYVELELGLVIVLILTILMFVILIVTIHVWELSIAMIPALLATIFGIECLDKGYDIFIEHKNKFKQFLSSEEDC